MWKIIVFIVISGILAFLSRKCLTSPRSHGFYRFLAWEFILVLLLHNREIWFHRPLSPHQILSWILLVSSVVMVTCGSILLRRYGRPDTTRTDEALLGFEKTTLLVSEGLYRYIRHPLYGSLLLLAWGAFLKNPFWWPGALLVAAATVALVLTAKVEENESLLYFGPAYADYMRRTKMFIPFVL